MAQSCVAARCGRADLLFGTVCALLQDVLRVIFGLVFGAVGSVFGLKV